MQGQERLVAVIRAAQAELTQDSLSFHAISDGVLRNIREAHTRCQQCTAPKPFCFTYYWV